MPPEANTRAELIAELTRLGVEGTVTMSGKTVPMKVYIASCPLPDLQSLVHDFKLGDVLNNDQLYRELEAELDRVSPVRRDTKRT